MIDETKCQKCGETLIAISENVGYQAPDPEKVETYYQCPKGCTN